jgi:hypothetical protein
MRAQGGRGVARAGAVAMAIVAAAVPLTGLASGTPFIAGFSTITKVASTVPANGDLNPYGVAPVPATHGRLHRGDVLVSNFNSSSNQQGTGTTIVSITPTGAQSVFATLVAGQLDGPCPGGVGLTTALSVLSTGWVIVGSLPTTDGTSATTSAGCLIVLDDHGQAVGTISGHGINGPWDMTAVESHNGSQATLFVTNVLNGTRQASPHVVNRGTVLRIVLKVDTQHRAKVPKATDFTIIGSGFGERTDPAALVIGPTGVGLGAHGTLYVADTLDNRVAAIPDAMTRGRSDGAGDDVSAGGQLNNPLGLVIAPNGDILTVNAGDGLLLETTPSGDQVASTLLDSSGSPPGAGALFGLAIQPGGHGVYFVDDAATPNQLDLLH